MKIKRFVALVLVAVMLLGITSCKGSIFEYYWSPRFQEGTVWTAEGADISFGVYPEDQKILVYDLMNAPVLSDRAKLEHLQLYMTDYGSLIRDGKQYNFVVYFWEGQCMEFISTDVSSVQDEGNSYYEVMYDFMISRFRLKFKSESVCIATVEESTIFEPGTEFVFRRSFME